MAFEADPAAFTARWADDERGLRDRLTEARARLPHIVLTDDLLDLIARICTEAGVGGLRADLTIHKAACTLAAYASRTTVAIEDIRTAAELALPHRSRQPQSPDAPLPERVDDLLREHEEKGENAPDDSPSQMPDETNRTDGDGGNDGSTIFDAAPTRVLSLPNDPKDRITSAGGRRGASMPQAGIGRASAVAATTPNGGSLAVAATIRAAATHQGTHPERESSNGMAIQVHPEDVRVRHRAPSAGHCVLFVVDASGSMAAERRMAVAKGAALDLLTDVYQRRDHVGLIAFRGARAELVLPPTRSTATAEQRLRVLPTGGRTPLADALLLAREVFARPAHRGQRRVLVVLSDGRANVSHTGDTPLDAAYREARALRDTGLTALVLDSETGPVHLGLALRLASELGADYQHLGEEEPAHGAQMIRAALPAVFDSASAAAAGGR